MAQEIVADRLLLDRDGVADRLGVVPGTVSHWRYKRSNTHFPLPVHVKKRVQWWDACDIDDWWADHQAIKRSRLTTVDRNGDPHELIDSTEAARILGYTRPRNLTPAFLRRADEIETTPNGRHHRRWRRSTAWTYADSRSNP
jgi:predicted DNA-binding transcriptional regulator AlpA